MESILDVLIKLGFDPTAPRQKREPSLDELLSWSSASQTRRLLDSSVRSMEALQVENPERKIPGHLRARIERLQWQLHWIEEKDRRQAERPEGCWCLGEGGRHPGYRLDREPTYMTFCTCPEGRALKERDRVFYQGYYADLADDRAQFLLGGASIPEGFEEWSFDTFPERARQRPYYQTARSWPVPPEGVTSESQIVEEWRAFRKHGLYLYGPCGTGKTSLAVSILRAWVLHYRKPATYLFVPAFLDRLRATYRDGATEDADRLTDAAEQVPLLILDDLNAHQVTEWVRERVFMVINSRWAGKRETIVTSNSDPDALKTTFNERMVSRLQELCRVVECAGADLRLAAH